MAVGRAYTHYSVNGTDTIYISAEARLRIPTRIPTETYFVIVNKCLKDFLFDVNRTVYARGNQPSSNHLFISLTLAWGGESSLKLDEYILQYDDADNESFSFYPFDPTNKHDRTLANFANYSCYESVKKVTINLTEWSVSYVKHPYEPTGHKKNETHSECSVLHYFTQSTQENPSIVDRILKCIMDSDKPVKLLRVVQIGLHSFNDFCTACNELVYKKQEELRLKLEMTLPSEYAANIVFLICGFNNRCYYSKNSPKLSSIYCTGTRQETARSYRKDCWSTKPQFGYFLDNDSYKTFDGVCNVDNGKQAPLFIFISEPTWESTQPNHNTHEVSGHEANEQSSPCVEFANLSVSDETPAEPLDPAVSDS